MVTASWDSWKDVKKEYPNLRYRDYLRTELKFFIGRIFSNIVDTFGDVRYFFIDLIVQDPAPLTKDGKVGCGICWWTKAIARSILCCMVWYNPIKYIRETRSRKRWWDGKTEGQRHWHIEEQQRLLGNMLEPLEKLMERLAEDK